MKKYINVLIAAGAAGAFGWSTGTWIFDFPSPTGLGMGLAFITFLYGILLVIGSSNPKVSNPE